MQTTLSLHPPMACVCALAGRAHTSVCEDTVLLGQNLPVTLSHADCFCEGRLPIQSPMQDVHTGVLRAAWCQNRAGCGQCGGGHG